jgi:hypothetical protein
MELIVYSSTWCPDCREAKRFLEKHKIPYTEINIETVIDGEWIQPYKPGRGFLYDEMSARLGVQDQKV